MKRISIAVLCGAAALTFGVLTAASASAFAPEPEYKVCGKRTKGEYNNKTCTEKNAKHEGKYESKSVTEGTKFTSKSKGGTFKVAGKTVKCKKDTDKGEFLGGRISLVEITFTDCVSGSTSCKSPGAASGTIKTEALGAFLEYLTELESGSALGVELEGFEGTFVVIECGSESVAVQGGAVGTVSNTAKGVTFGFTVNSHGEQNHKTFWVEGSEKGPDTLYTNGVSGKQEATLTDSDEQGPKGVRAV